MIHHNNNGQEYLMVDLPADAKGIEISTDFGDLCYFQGEPSLASAKFQTLPPGQWQILFLASEATEEQAGEVVERVVVKPKFVGDKSQTFYYDYGHRFYIMKFATQSLKSLLSSHGMEGETLFLKRVK